MDRNFELVRNQGFILSGEGYEFPLGCDALKALGIDVQGQLALLAREPFLRTEEDEFPVGDNLPEAEKLVEDAPDLDKLVANAMINGLSTLYVAVVRAILGQFPDVWCETIGPGHPARVEPPQVNLRAGVAPPGAPTSLCSTPDSVWSSLCRIAGFQRLGCAEQCVAMGDCSGVCKQSWISLPLPRDDRLQACAPSNCTNCWIDVHLCYYNGLVWQEEILRIPLFYAGILAADIACGEPRDILFHYGNCVLTPNRISQGATDSALHIPGVTSKVLTALIPHPALVWVADAILFTLTVETFVMVLGRLFSLIEAAQLKLNMAI
ncbi:hypothetical protein PHMEG_00022506 [Phytophthora megakarya]|uniref:Uncharacterized protein n=1 Tax=Phytophthora megakarya TaxID=4795 RepID=A0A225VJA6_9STRA|nr:hypothetical protein PHMEG_00022506 [Phytophthora megakarya]